MGGKATKGSKTKESPFAALVPPHFIKIDFDLAQHDVVATKLRSFLCKHPGNVFYTKLINNCL